MADANVEVGKEYASGLYTRRPGERGYTLIEVAIAVGIMAVIMVGLGHALRVQARLTGQSADAADTFLAAEAALQRVLDELRSTVQLPTGVSGVTLSATSISYRIPERYLSPVDPDYDTYLAAGRLSSNGILYSAYLKTIQVESGELVIRATGTLPPGMKAREVLTRNVTDFGFYDGESKAANPMTTAPGTGTWVIGVRLTVGRKSSVAENRGQVADSNVRKVQLRAKALVAPEALVNTPNRPMVGP